MARPTSVPNTFSPQAGALALSQLDDNNSALLGFNDSSNGWVNFANDTGAANNYVVTLIPAPSAYIAGMALAFVATNTNTGGSSINVNGLGSQTIVNASGKALTAGTILANRLTFLVYDGSAFRVCTHGPISFTSAGASGTVSIECAGATSVQTNITVSGALTVNLNHLPTGIPVTLVWFNGTGSTQNVTLNANGATGVGYASISGKSAGITFANLNTFSVGTGAASSVFMTGASTSLGASNQLYFVYA
jgi:hypothetical protein